MNMKAAPIIVKKKKGGHGGHHGGAWKVAYADFVTAMMAFFLVMWLVNQSKAVKSSIGSYFRDPVSFEAGGRGVLPGGTAVTANVGTTSQADEKDALEKAVGRIREHLNETPGLQVLKKQVEFNVSSEGLRIDLLENDKSSFFDTGSALLRDETVRLLGIIAHELGGLQDDVVVEGHTDSRPYAKNDRYGNWELSADRANAARRVMEKEGLREHQVTGVRGLADRQLRIPSDSLDPRNRRVTILVKQREGKTASD
jgi:chemotaxis protein MotB